MEPLHSPCRGEESKLKESIRWDPFLVKSSDSNGFWPCEQKGNRGGALSKSGNDNFQSQTLIISHCVKHKLTIDC